MHDAVFLSSLTASSDPELEPELDPELYPELELILERDGSERSRRVMPRFPLLAPAPAAPPEKGGGTVYAAEKHPSSPSAPFQLPGAR